VAEDVEIKPGMVLTDGEGCCLSTQASPCMLQIANAGENGKRVL